MGEYRGRSKEASVIEERGNPARRLEGKIALVVGGGQHPGDTIGNGKATAKLFAHHGAQVVVVDAELDRAESTVAEIREDGGEATACRADVTSEADSMAMVEQAKTSYGGLDILHYNVGIGTGDRGVHATEVDAWRNIHEVNLTGAFLASRAAAPALRERDGGVMLFISSVASVAGVKMSAYKTSKAALNALAHTLAVTHAREGIRVNTILPGLIDTPMAIQGLSATLGVDPDKLREKRNQVVPLGKKMGSAWDIAYAALYLASDEACWVTGVELLVDGGQMTRKA